MLSRKYQPMRAASMNATTSASSNSTTRALVLWRVILPASAYRKIVLGQMPSRSAMDLALLNLRPAKPSKCATRAASDFVVVSMVSFLCVPQRIGNSVAPPKLRQSIPRKNGRRTRPAFDPIA